MYSKHHFFLSMCQCTGWSISRRSWASLRYLLCFLIYFLNSEATLAPETHVWLLNTTGPHFLAIPPTPQKNNKHGSQWSVAIPDTYAHNWKHLSFFLPILRYHDLSLYCSPLTILNWHLMSQDRFTNPCLLLLCQQPGSSLTHLPSNSSNLSSTVCSLRTQRQYTFSGSAKSQT